MLFTRIQHQSITQWQKQNCRFFSTVKIMTINGVHQRLTHLMNINFKWGWVEYKQVLPEWMELIFDANLFSYLIVPLKLVHMNANDTQLCRKNRFRHQ